MHMNKHFKFMFILISLLLVLGVCNIVYMINIQTQLHEMSKEIRLVKNSVHEISAVPQKGEERYIDPYNPNPNSLQDILDRLDKAEKNIHYEINRNRF